jgi:hypothetical protein
MTENLTFWNTLVLMVILVIILAGLCWEELHLIKEIRDKYLTKIVKRGKVKT